MLTDAELSLAVGCHSKWIYNAAQRTGRPIQRTVDGAIWWRLTHQLASNVGVPLASAVAGADSLVALGPNAGRVKLRATQDDAVAISVDLPRFFDGAALAVAAAIELAVRKPRGRPRKRRLTPPHVSTPLPLVPSGGGAAHLSSVLDSVPPAGGGSARRLMEALVDLGIAPVIVGGVAAAYYGISAAPLAVDLVVSTSGSRAGSLAELLNATHALPRGVPARAGFRFDAPLVRATDHLALSVAGVAVNIGRSLASGGDYAQIFASAEMVEVDGRTYAVLAGSELLRDRS